MFASLLTGGLAGLALSACFELPADDVTFACDPDTSSLCPSGYTCQRDGCCHRNGAPVESNLGACRLGGAGTGTGGTGTGGTGG